MSDNENDPVDSDTNVSLHDDTDDDTADDTAESDNFATNTAATTVISGYHTDLTYNNGSLLTNNNTSGLATISPRFGAGYNSITNVNTAVGANALGFAYNGSYASNLSTSIGAGAVGWLLGSSVSTGSGISMIGSNTNIGDNIDAVLIGKATSSKFRDPITYDDIAKLLVKVDELEKTVKELADSNNKLVDTINSITHHPTFGTLTNVDKSGFKRAMLRQRSH